MNESKKPRRPREMLEINGRKVSRSLHSKLIAIRADLDRLNNVERLNLPDIAARLSVSRETAATWAELLGVTILNSYRRPRLDKSTWAKLLPPMRKRGMTYKEIGAQVGATNISVCRWFLNQGIVTNKHYNR